MAKLADKVAIITGASSGIGEATALALGKRGAKVVLAARRVDRLKDLVRRIIDQGGKAVDVECDVAKRSEVDAMVETAMRDFKRVDVLINNAGIMPLAPMAKCRMDDWDATIDINIKGLLYCIGFVLPIMLKQKSGHIVNVSSVGGRRVFPNAAVYCGTKFAVHAISESLRSELAECRHQDGNTIRVTTIAPGVVKTELTDSITDATTQEQVKEYVNKFDEPLTSKDIADSIVYALETPLHVGVDEILIRPTSQVS